MDGIYTLLSPWHDDPPFPSALYEYYFRFIPPCLSDGLANIYQTLCNKAQVFVMLPCIFRAFQGLKRTKKCTETLQNVLFYISLGENESGVMIQILAYKLRLGNLHCPFKLSQRFWKISTVQVYICVTRQQYIEDKIA